MQQEPRHKFNVYSELYPASSVAIIGSGIITVTMGDFVVGSAFVFSGIAVGLAGQFARAAHERKLAKQRRYSA
jgi:hypothetical protein